MTLTPTMYCRAISSGALRLRSVAAGIRKPTFRLRGQRSNQLWYRRGSAKIGKLVKILAAYSCTFSNLSVSKIEPQSHTTDAYSSIGLTKVKYIFDKQSKFFH